MTTAQAGGRTLDPTLLEIRALHVSIRDRARAIPILRGVDVRIESGEVHGLVGESGAGKSMLGKVILGIQPHSARVDSGAVRFEGRDITNLSQRARQTLMATGIAFIPQHPLSSLNPAFTIGTQIAGVLRLHLGLNRAQAHRRVLELLRDVHIRAPDRVSRQYAHELSGGMRQRVLIAMAFACRPRLIVADEPTTALDVTVQRQVLRLIRDLQRDAGTAILFITHAVGVVAKLCERMTVLHAGRVLERGTVAEVLARPVHPYTRALLQATPRYDRPRDSLEPVPAELTRRLLAEAEVYDRQRSGGDAYDQQRSGGDAA
jgi:peptide/nickel transport system ATP-binding protein